MPRKTTCCSTATNPRLTWRPCAKGINPAARIWKPTITFNPGETTKNIIVSVNGDTSNETDETFVVTLRRSTNASLVDPDAQGTIMNDDPLPSLSVGDVSVTEGDSGLTDAVFPVSLSTASGQTVTVNYATADGTASEHPGNDYTGDSGTITFAPGETDDEIDTTVTGDTNVEPNEKFFANLSSPTLATDRKSVV